jgi:sialidase-1
MRTTVLLALALAFALHAAEPEKTDLFRAGEGGYASYRIPGIVVTAKGTVLAYCEARKNNAADWGEIHVLLRRSTDGGRTFDAPRQIAHTGAPVPRERFTHGRKPKTEGEQTVNNPVAIATRDGAVHFLYCIEYAVCFHMRSDDDGVTWSAPVGITAAFEKFRPEYAWHVIATGPGHGIQLRGGRLVVPVWLCSGRGGAHHPSVAATIFSDDGKTWQRGDIAAPNTPEMIDPNETTAAELSDGRVMLNIRSLAKAQRRIVTTSADGATGWSAPRFDDALFEPVCFGSIVRFPLKKGRAPLVFSCPDPVEKGRTRRNLTLRVSDDDGTTWKTSRVLEPGPSAYSDLAVLPGGVLLCLYERGDTGPNEKLTLARIALGWLRGE